MPSLYRVAIALLATVVGGAPTFITSPIDRPLVLGLPIIVVSLAYLLTRIGDRRPVTIDLVCATLLAAPGIACHSWLSLRGSDATNWYFPELRVLGVIEQSGAGAATIGILWSGAIALLALRGRRSLPSAVALFAGGAWLGLGTLLLKQLVYVLYHSPPQALIYALAAVNQWQIGALFGALLVWTAAARVQPSLGARIALAVFAAILTAACTVPVVAIAHMVDLAPLQTELQQTPPGPRGVGIVYDAPEGASAEALTILLQVRGQSTKPDTWTPNRDRKLPWHRALRLGLVVAVPPSTTRADLDALARVARQHGALRIELSTRATGLPPGVMNTLLGWPTVGLLLDPPPEDTVWGTLLSDGTIRWDDAVPAFDTAPHCALRAEATVSVGMLSTALFDIARASRTLRCRGIAWPPPRCHPEGAGDPLCPGMTTDAD